MENSSKHTDNIKIIGLSNYIALPEDLCYTYTV